MHLSLFTTFFLPPSNILVCPPNIFDKSTPVLLEKGTFKVTFIVKFHFHMIVVFCPMCRTLSHKRLVMYLVFCQRCTSSADDTTHSQNSDHLVVFPLRFVNLS